MNPLYSQVITRLQTAQRILLITHISPDGDALGSLGFMMEWLKSLGKPYTAYTAGPLPSALAFLPGYHEMITDKGLFKLNDFDLIISLDCGSLPRTNLAEEISQRRPEQFFIEIDHHPSVENVSDLEIRELSASTTEILYHIAEVAGLRLNSKMAHCLLTGILTDTGSFTFSSTSEKTIAAASQMLLGGASLAKIINKTWRTKDVTDLRLWGIALSRLEKLQTYDITYTVLKQSDFLETDSDEEAMEGLAEFLSSLADTKAILLLREDSEGRIRGNLRTVHDTVDVGQLARRLGGGGHRKAAGFILSGRLVKTAHGWKVEN